MGVIESEAREHERRSEWRMAAAAWRRLEGRESDAKACDWIADAVELGDAWRAQPEPRPEFYAFALQYEHGELARRLS